MNDLTLLVASSPLPAGTPVRILVPGVPSARDPLLAAVRRRRSEDEELVWSLGADDLEAEYELLDRWTDLTETDRSRVFCVIGRQAGHLMRFDDRATAGFAFLGEVAREADLLPNAQARALLAAEYPDTFTLALDRGPQVDADRWRFRLATTASERWGIGLVERPVTGFGAMLRELDLGPPLPPPKVMFAVTPRSQAAPGLDAETDWLDLELVRHSRVMFEDGAVVDGDGREPAAPMVWQRARAASIERRLRRIENVVIPSAASQGDRVDTATGLLVNDPSAASARLDPKVLRGKRGRLFLASDSHDSHSQITGQRRLADEELDQWERGMRERMLFADSLDAPLVTLLGPAPQVVYSDCLPHGVEISKKRPVRQLLNRLAAMDPDPIVVYPLTELAEGRRLLDPFPKTDSHWNDFGAFLAYEALMNALPDAVPHRKIGRGDVSLHPTVYTGDLGTKVRPERACVFLRARIDRPRARLIEDNRVRNHGRMAIYECPAAKGTCVLFGDSWAYTMLLYLAESFQRLVFFHRVNVVDAEPLLSERPDLALVVLTERFLTALPDDKAAVPFEEVVAKKRRGGHLVPESRAPKTRAAFLHSVQLERDLPDEPRIPLPIAVPV